MNPGGRLSKTQYFVSSNNAKGHQGQGHDDVTMATPYHHPLAPLNIGRELKKSTLRIDTR